MSIRRVAKKLSQKKFALYKQGIFLYRETFSHIKSHLQSDLVPLMSPDYESQDLELEKESHRKVRDREITCWAWERKMLPLHGGERQSKTWKKNSIVWGGWNRKKFRPSPRHFVTTQQNSDTTNSTSGHGYPFSRLRGHIGQSVNWGGGSLTLLPSSHYNSCTRGG